jgi:hypothetical protein
MGGTKKTIALSYRSKALCLNEDYFFVSWEIAVKTANLHLLVSILYLFTFVRGD